MRFSHRPLTPWLALAGKPVNRCPRTTCAYSDCRAFAGIPSRLFLLSESQRACLEPVWRACLEPVRACLEPLEPVEQAFIRLGKLAHQQVMAAAQNGPPAHREFIVFPALRHPPKKCRLLGTPVLQPQYCCRARRGVSKRCAHAPGAGVSKRYALAPGAGVSKVARHGDPNLFRDRLGGHLRLLDVAG